MNRPSVPAPHQALVALTLVSALFGGAVATAWSSPGPVTVGSTGPGATASRGSQSGSDDVGGASADPGGVDPTVTEASDLSVEPSGGDWAGSGELGGGGGPLDAPTGDGDDDAVRWGSDEEVPLVEGDAWDDADAGAVAADPGDGAPSRVVDGGTAEDAVAPGEAAVDESGDVAETAEVNEAPVLPSRTIELRVPLGQRVDLATDSSLAAGWYDPDGTADWLCLQFTPERRDFWLDGADCSGAGLWARIQVAGTYVVRIRAVEVRADAPSQPGLRSEGEVVLRLVAG